MHMKKIIAMIVLPAAIIGLLLYTAINADSFMWVSLGFGGLAFLYLLVRFEKRKVEPRELVLLAVLASIAAVGRIPFASIPGVQPTTFVIIMAGIVFGAESGFLVGAVAALASNMILGQGPWTPWQMAAWGLVGLTAGLMSKTGLMKTMWGKIAFGFCWGFLFGWIMNLWGYLAFIQTGGEVSLATLGTYFAASSLFDFLHAASNVFFLLVFSGSWLKSLARFKRKYGLLE
ncbi:ECF transporter S component [Neobacillus notoginsengisoli]|uniref:ECF transporter S component n=1 Tax=Neobacillus notoginsengisoli TaxID=1578198 RepID=A0A417YXZ0_9BACI|nr:ECF transporter S component [Neobacillus notoginsengisoli]RHW42574.1 ECF transporter S component [Neobacillus notoginsengisoli]